MIFRDETRDEVRFFEEAFDHFADGRVHRLLEPGCGSGRLVAALAAKGYDVAGLDLHPAMIRYLSRRLQRRGLHAAAVVGDMTAMEFDEPFDAAFCTFNTFRHLPNEAAAVSHLRSVADNVRRGGLYILGYHIIPDDAEDTCIERWKASHGGTNVDVKFAVTSFDRKKRFESITVTLKAKKRSGLKETLRSDFKLRTYNSTQTKRLLKKVADVWEIAEVFDFDYDIDCPREINEDLNDALFVLKRR